MWNSSSTLSVEEITITEAQPSTLQQRTLYFILFTYLLIATTYSVVIPIFEVSDELWHYPMVHYIANNGLQLPVQNPGNVGLWRQEGSQPPLYYMVAAVLTAGIDTSDLTTVRRQNPHADIGVIRPDGNANMIVHRAEAFPWSGTTLAVHVIRLFSIALGAGTVYITYLLARELFPERPVVWIGAAALNAYLPMFVFISASVNNDNLSNLLGNLLTLLMVRLLNNRLALNWRSYTLIGVVMGAGLLAKLNLGFFIPIIGLCLLIVSVHRRDWRPLVIGGLISGAITIVIAGWWYWRNYNLYGDPTGLEMFLSVVGRRLVPANAQQLWAERHSFTQAYWGFFGGMNVPMPNMLYLIFNIIGGFALVSVLAFIAYTVVRRRWTLQRWLPALITLLWIVVTFISFLRWTSETPATQGRLVFGALSSLSIWMAVGLTWWLPRQLRPVSIGTVAGYFAVVAVIAPFMFIAPAYAPPRAIPAGEAEAMFSESDNLGAIGLLNARVISEQIHPDEYVVLETDWQIDQPLTRDWSIFVHLTTPEGVIISQRDVYPGGGRLATSDFAQWYSWRNPIAVPVPRAAFAPTVLDVNIGWYHLPTGERLTLEDGAEVITVGQVELLPRETTLGVSNPVSVNFDNQLELIGYDLSTLTPITGETVELVLYWRRLQQIEQDYVVFAHIIDPATFTIVAGSDAQPVAWTRPTSTWAEGEIITDSHTLTVREDGAPGIYELEVGLYWAMEDGTFPRLRIVTEDGGMADNWIYLSRVRVLPVETVESAS